MGLEAEEDTRMGTEQKGVELDPLKLNSPGAPRNKDRGIRSECLKHRSDPSR